MRWFRRRPVPPRGVRLHVRWLPEPIDLELSYGGVDDEGLHTWVARLPISLKGEDIDIFGVAPPPVSCDYLPGNTKVSIELTGEP